MFLENHTQFTEQNSEGASEARDTSLSMEDIAHDMQLEGSTPLHGEIPYTEHPNLHNREEEAKVLALQAERSRALSEEYQALVSTENGENRDELREAHATEKIAIIREKNGIDAHKLYTQLDKLGANTEEGQNTHSAILETFTSELSQIKDIAEGNENPIIKANIASRELELQKMEIELEIRWKQKQIWELHVDWSPEKENMEREVQQLKFEGLKPLLESTVETLTKEEELLTSEYGAIDWSARLGYVTGRRIELQNTLDHLERESQSRTLHIERA